MPDRATLLAQAEQGAISALQAIQALKALGDQPAPPLAPAPAVASPAADSDAHGLRNPKGFFDHMRASKIMGPSLSPEEVGGCGAILDACAGAAWPLSWTAYGLATAYHETAATLQPIREYGRGKGRKYGVPGKHGQIAYGRGYVQLTWDTGYEKADQKLGLGGRLTSNYELALDPEIAAAIMVRGMAEGWFTGKKLADYLPSDGPSSVQPYREARRIINGTDKADLIASHAMTFQEALMKGSWT